MELIYNVIASVLCSFLDEIQLAGVVVVLVDWDDSDDLSALISLLFLVDFLLELLLSKQKQLGFLLVGVVIMFHLTFIIV